MIKKSMQESVFRAYDVRGIYPEQINEWLAKKIGNFFPEVVNSKKVIVGYDMRTTSKNLFDALTDGLRLRGIDVYNIGLCSSPMFYFACAYYGFKGGIMVTASHNEKEFNGFKFVKEKAIPLTYDKIKKIEKKIKKRIKINNKKGKLIEFNIDDDYQMFLEEHLEGLKKLKVIVDAGNGMGGVKFSFLKKYLSIKNMYFKPDGSFPNHTPNPILKENIKTLIKRVKNSKVDLGIGFDGDVDRAVFIDEKGNPIKSDYIMALLIKELAEKGDKVVVDLRMSKILEEVCNEKGVTLIRSKVGHSNLTRMMRQKNAVLGGELSGHYYFKDNFYTDSGLLTAIKILNILSHKKEKISNLIKPFEKYFTSDEINYEVEDKDTLMKRFKKLKGKKNYLDGITISDKEGWFNIRKSNTENLIRLRIEATSIQKVHEIMNIVKNTIGKEEKFRQI